MTESRVRLGKVVWRFSCFDDSGKLGDTPVWLCWLGVRYRVGRVTLEEPQDVLFTDVSEPVAAR